MSRELARPLPDKLSIWPVEGGRFGLDAMSRSPGTVGIGGMPPPQAISVASLDDIGLVLEGAGYEVQRAELAGLPAFLAESLYALVACVELADWTDFSQHVFDAQAALTSRAGEAPSVPDRDLYLVIHVRSKVADQADYAALQGAEADIQHVRKLVRIAVVPSELERALRPLLPLRPGAVFGVVEPLQQLRDELRELGLEDRVADSSIGAFRDKNEVMVS